MGIANYTNMSELMNDVLKKQPDVSISDLVRERIGRTSCLFDPGSCMVDTIGTSDKPVYLKQEQKLR